MIKRYWSPLLLLFVCLFIYRNLVIFGKIPLPADTLVGAYFPWLDYKWGYQVGVPVKNAPTSDTFSQFYVWKMKMVDIYKQGHIPLWNNYSFSGTPLLATFHTSVFNPANLLLFVPRVGWGLYIMFSSIFAAFAMYLFLGLYTKNKLSQISGSLIFAFSGLMTTWAQFGTAVWAATYLPLVLYFLHQIINHSRLKLLPLFSLSVCFLIFSGNIQLLIYTATVSIFYAFWLFWQKQKINKKKIVLLVLASTIGLGLGAIQVLPSYELSKRSVRSKEDSLASINFGLAPFSQSVRLFAADFYGHPTTGNHFGSASYHENSSYLGVLTIPLIIFILLRYRKNNSATKFFLAVFMISIFLSISHPFSRWFVNLPSPISSHSSMSRILFLVSFSGSFLATMGLSNLSKLKSNRQVLISLLVVSVAIIVFLLFVDKQHRTISLRNAVFYEGLLFLAILGTIYLQKKLLIILFAIIFIFDFNRYFNKYTTFVSSHLIFPETPVTEFLKQQDSPFRIVTERTNLMPANTWTNYNLESIEGYDPLYSFDYAQFFHVVNGNPVSNAVGHYALLEKIRPKFLDALNVKYFLSVSENKILGYSEVFRDGHTRILRNPNVLGRAYFVSKIIPTVDKTKMFETISLPDFDPRNTAVVFTSDTLLASSSGTVVDLKNYDGRVTLNTISDRGGLLVLAENFDPGWKVKVNNRVAKVYQTNGSLMSIIVPQGRSLIEFYYLPDEYLLGLKISFFSILLLIILAISIRQPKK